MLGSFLACARRSLILYSIKEDVSKFERVAAAATRSRRGGSLNGCSDKKKSSEEMLKIAISFK
jgi:hypothetical protein